MINRKGAVKLNIVKVLILLLMVILAGCGYEEGKEPVSEVVVTGFKKPEVGTYDSIDTEAVVLSVDTENRSITLYNRVLEKNYTLNYDGTSKLYDRYGSSLVIDQIFAGDVVDVTFTKSTKLLNSMSKSADVWVYENIDDFEINSLTGNLSMNGGDYRLNDKLKIFLAGAEAQLIDINSCDKIAVAGKEHNVYSIVVQQGHGYLRLKGQDYFEGGWIEVGNKIIRTVTKDMLLAVPVGNYEVKLSNGEFYGSRKVSITSNKETELDVSDMVVIEEKNEGTLVLVIEPANATVHIDGKAVDLTKPLNLEYGIHQIIAQADGYKTLTQYIKVAQVSATLDITMEKSKSQSDIDSKLKPSPTVEATVITQVVSAFDTSDYRVYIESPEEVDVYLDGAYVGKVPVSFPKVEGEHVVTLRKEGYTTRSYTIRLDGSYQNETFSFSSLVVDSTQNKEADKSSEEQQEEENAGEPSNAQDNASDNVGNSGENEPADEVTPAADEPEPTSLNEENNDSQENDNSGENAGDESGSESGENA